MTTRHPIAEFYQGDTWFIAGALTNADDTPMHLDDSSVIRWALYDRTQTVKCEASLGNGISIVDGDAGTIMIELDGATKTKTIDIGAYQDQLQVIVNGVPMTLWKGQIDVDFSPFANPVTP